MQTPAAQNQWQMLLMIFLSWVLLLQTTLQRKLVQSNEHPGGNVSGTSDMTPVEKEADLIIALVPNVKRIGCYLHIF